MGVLQPLSGRVNGREHVLLGALGLRSPVRAQRAALPLSGPHAGAEVLGRESGAHDLLRVGIEDPKRYVPHLVLLVEVLES